MAQNVRRPPYLATFVASVIVLALIGIYATAGYQGAALVKNLRESVKLAVEMRPSITEAQRRGFAEWLAQQPFVKPESVTFVSQEEGARILREEYGEDFLSFDLDNPLYDTYTANLSAITVSRAQTAASVKLLQARDEVLGAYVQEDLASTLSARLDKVIWLLVGLAILLLAGVVMLMLNTTRLALLNRATVIRNMELVGASWGFIARPFLKRAILLGMLAGVSAGIVVLTVSAYAKTSLVGIWQDVPVWMVLIVGIGMVLLGSLLNFTATYSVIRRTLRMRVDDLAALA